MSAAYTTTATSCTDEPPPLPPKHSESVRNEHTNAPQPIMSSLALDIPLSPVSPSPLPSTVDRTRKCSPLTDLMESEKAYVELLTGIIRKVAAAWSRTNLPPPELDAMFRSVEGIYKTNRTLLAKLKEIGENPSSPKALGDLLMRWIDELEQPYMSYADRYCIGFDDWEFVKSNLKLPIILQTFSESNPPPSALPQSTRLLNPSLWTLDALFLLPKGRLQYYRKLYSKLLKSTTPGRSDYRLLTGALGKLDDLLATLDDRASVGVGAARSLRMPLLPHTSSQADPTTVVSIELATNESMGNGVLLSGQFGTNSASVATDLRSNYSSRGESLSEEVAIASVRQESSRNMLLPLLDLERRLATERTLDVFTMQPKQIRLQIVPPTLSYTREIRLSVRVVVRFTPKATGVEVVHRHGHVYILSDLVLLCEEMTRDERAARGEDGQDMHLCYPPLSGKVLNVTGVPGQENALQVSVMRKETLVLEAGSQPKRDQIVNEFQECISFAKTISRAMQEPVPPIPPIDSPSQSPAVHLETPGSPSRERPDRLPNPRLLLQPQSGNVQPKRANDVPSAVERIPITFSPTQNNGLPVMSPLQTRFEQQNVVLTQLETTQPHDIVFSSPSSSASTRDGQGVPPLHDLGPVYPPRGSSAGYGANNPSPSFLPGQIVPPIRGTSIQPELPLAAIPTSDSPGGPNGKYSPPTTQNPAPQNLLRHHASTHSPRQQPLQHQPSLHSLRHEPNYQNTVPLPPLQLSPNSPDRPPFPIHPSGTPGISQPVESSSRRLQKSPSSRSLHAQHQYNQSPLPPIPLLPNGLPMPQRLYSQRNNSAGSLNMQMSRPLLPSMQMGSRTNSVAEPSILDPSPPTSPVEERKPLEPVRSVITAQMKCKVFHQQQHAQWRSLGSANLTLYRQEPTNVKQLVVEASGKEKSILISTIVLTDGVERVGKTGVAVELSDAGGSRTGVIHMIQLRDEDSASKLYKTLLVGSDRAA